MAQIYLVRHTNVGIAAGTCYGISDIPLAPGFPDEASIISHKLQGITFDKVYSSPLKRCTQLAQILSPGNYVMDQRLTEMNFGNWEGLSWNDIYKLPYGKEWMNNYLELPCPDGESYIDLHNRITAFVNELDKGQNTLIITHAGVIRVFLSIFEGIEGKSVFDRKIDFGEIVKIGDPTSYVKNTHS
jgi:alpha-ribazole phosphatase